MNIGEDEDSRTVIFAPIETDTPAPVETVPSTTPTEVPAEEPVGV